MKTSLCGYALIVLLLYVCLKVYQDSDMFNLKCIISGVDGKKYCVRDRSKLELAADRLAVVNQKMSKLVEHCYKTYPTRENIKRLKKGYNPKKIMETLPTSEYTAYSENKLIEFFLKYWDQKGLGYLSGKAHSAQEAAVEAFTSQFADCAKK